MLGLKFRGRPPIDYAGSVKDVVAFKNEYAQEIMDRSKHIDEDFVGAILGQSVMQWSDRAPTPALDEDGNFCGTDLDLFSFLVPLAARNAVIEIPHYKNRTQKVIRPDEWHIDGPRFGNIIRLISHQDALSFSVLIFDRSIVRRDSKGRETIGAPRDFMLVDYGGVWHEGWHELRFHPTAPENEFLRDKHLFVGDTVSFSNYVHPARWQSIFSAAHFLKKMLLARIKDEAIFCRSEIKRLSAKGGEYVDREEGEEPESRGETCPIKVRTLEMELDMPNLAGAYVSYKSTRVGWDAVRKHYKFLKYEAMPMVQFAVRANEAAYFLFGKSSGGEWRIPYWMGNREWQEGVRLPRGRIDWNRMVLSNDCALRFRVKEVTKRVAADSIDS